MLELQRSLLFSTALKDWKRCKAAKGMLANGTGTFIFLVVTGKKMCQLVFQKIGPTLKSKVDEDAKLTVEATSADAPMAKLSFKAEATDIVVSALKEALS